MCITIMYSRLHDTRGVALAAAQMTLRVFLLFWYLLLWWYVSLLILCIKSKFLFLFLFLLGRVAVLGWFFGWPSDVFVWANEKSRIFNYCNIIVSSFFLFGIIVIVISDYILLDFTTEKKNLENKPTSSNLWYKRAIIIT